MDTLLVLLATGDGNLSFPKINNQVLCACQRLTIAMVRDDQGAFQCTNASPLTPLDSLIGARFEVLLSNLQLGMLVKWLYFCIPFVF